MSVRKSSGHHQLGRQRGPDGQARFWTTTIGEVLLGLGHSRSLPILLSRGEGRQERRYAGRDLARQKTQGTDLRR